MTFSIKILSINDISVKQHTVKASIVTMLKVEFYTVMVSFGIPIVIMLNVEEPLQVVEKEAVEKTI
jgi:hypothetical protein